MRTLKLTLAYDGTNYVGWQRQLNGVSVQQLLEEAFVPLVGFAPTIAAAGRTDAGVHARGQVASVSVDVNYPAPAVQRALNVRLPQDIRVVDAIDERTGFHARSHALGKCYRYRCVTTAVVMPFERWFVWHLPEPRDLEAMQRAARAFVGTHDFVSFQARGSDIGETTRTISRVDVTQSGGALVIDVEGNGFLRHMVRVMVGTLADVGVGLKSADAIPAILAARDRAAAGPTAPAQGLTLMSVAY